MDYVTKRSGVGKTRKSTRLALYVAALVGVGFGIDGCVEPYPHGRAGVVYGSPGYVSIAVGDRPYYTRGPGYYVGRSYYVWRPGRWRHHHGRRFWIHGRYVVRP